MSPEKAAPGKAAPGSGPVTVRGLETRKFSEFPSLIVISDITLVNKHITHVNHSLFKTINSVDMLLWLAIYHHPTLWGLTISPLVWCSLHFVLGLAVSSFSHVESCHLPYFIKLSFCGGGWNRSACLLCRNLVSVVETQKPNLFSNITTSAVCYKNKHYFTVFLKNIIESQNIASMYFNNT